MFQYEPARDQHKAYGNLARIVSGGQTGVDQAALRAAQAVGLNCGGWCSPGRVCDDGLIPSQFPLRETPQERSPTAPDVPRSQRTEWNVRDSDATLVFQPAGANAHDAGTEWTIQCARSLGKPLLICNPSDAKVVEQIVAWLRRAPSPTLTVAGPSERATPGIGATVERLLTEVFQIVKASE